MLIALHKPYDVLSQFTRECDHHRTLADFGLPAHVYPIGRLDRDSEGLLLLSDEPQWTDRLLNPKRGHWRTYHAQVEGMVTDDALAKLRGGVRLREFTTRPAKAARISPNHAERTPPIRFRKQVPTCWIELCLTEGKNRQVRRMTAAVGFPTLRLIRVAIGGFAPDLAPGEWRELSAQEQRGLLREYRV